MPLNFEGLRRLPGSKRLTSIARFRQWLSGQPVLHRVGLGIALYLVLALTAYALFGANACAVMVNGKTIAIAADEKSARGALGELIKLKSDQVGRHVTVEDKVGYRGIRLNREEVLDQVVLDQEVLMNKLDEALSFRAKVAIIMINGEQKIFLKNEGEAEELLAWLKTVYPLDDGEQIVFKENVETIESYGDVDGIMDMEAAKKLVLMGSNRVDQYIVKDGDTLWDIAHAVKIDQEQIIFSNPGMDPENLSINQALNLSREAPLITVVATRQVTISEEVPYQVEVKKDDKLLMGEKKIVREGVPGERTVTYRITKENGLEIGREVLEQNVIREAETEVVVKGSVTMLASRGGSARLNWPSPGGIVSSFGMRWGRMHEGIDIGSSYGSTVVASAGGTVIATGWNGGYGNTVDVSHGGGLVTRYAHLSSINVRNGQSVNRGQMIGRVGSTGRSTGPHLHFEVRINGQPRNPANYLP